MINLNIILMKHEKRVVYRSNVENFDLIFNRFSITD